MCVGTERKRLDLPSKPDPHSRLPRAQSLADRVDPERRIAGDAKIALLHAKGKGVGVAGRIPQEPVVERTYSLGVLAGCARDDDGKQVREWAGRGVWWASGLLDVSGIGRSVVTYRSSLMPPAGSPNTT